MQSRYLTYLWCKYIEPHDPFNKQLKQAIKSCLAALICIELVIHNEIKAGMWLIFAVIFIMQMARGNKIKTQILTQLCGGLILTLAMTLSAYLGNILPLFIIIMFLATWYTFYLQKYGADIYLPAFYILMVILFSGSYATNWYAAGQRGLAGIVATIIALIISHLIWPFRPAKELQRSLKRSTIKLSLYAKFIIDDSLRGNFNRLQRYEKKAKVLEAVECSRNLRQEKLFMLLAALSDILNKPNSEYTLDIIIEPLNKLTPFLVTAIKEGQVADEFLTVLHELKDTALSKPYKTFIVEDINNIYYLLNKIYALIRDIA